MGVSSSRPRVMAVMAVMVMVVVLLSQRRRQRKQGSRGCGDQATHGLNRTVKLF
ncbi:MAG: hypothetical protein QUV04_12285 [Synechococcus sp. WH 8007]|nr:hypothetical protein [Synechococcus sp. WH 8007]